MKEKKKVKMIMSIEVDTDSTVEEIKKAMERGIYVQLDTRRVAPPSDIKILYCQEK